jgi:hypothetical protein
MSSAARTTQSTPRRYAKRCRVPGCALFRSRVRSSRPRRCCTRRVCTRRSNSRPRSGDILRLRGGVKPGEGRPGMFAVETYAAVRRFVFVEGKSRREAARVFELSRETIAKMCRYLAPPGSARNLSGRSLDRSFQSSMRSSRQIRRRHRSKGTRQSGFLNGCGSNTALPAASETVSAVNRFGTRDR